METFSTQFHMLITLFDQEHSLTHNVRVRMYEELLDAVTSDYLLSTLLLDDILKGLRQYCDELASSHDYHTIYKFEDTFSKWMHIPAKTVYHNPQNAHMFMTPAVQAAKEIMNKYPSVYIQRPFEHSFFDMIETEVLVNGIHMPSLFASVWEYISNHKEKDLMTRLLEEMDDSVDMCLSGHLVRLVNSVKGFDNNSFHFNIELYEYNKARVFHLINKTLDLTTLDNFLERMQIALNGVLNEVINEDISTHDILQILKDYSKHQWLFVDGKFTYIK